MYSLGILSRGIGVMMPVNLPKEGYKPLPEQ
jgi:hypothetical protein